MERLKELYRRYASCDADSIEKLPLSGSARKYYRMSGKGPDVIGVIGTNLKENRAFLTICAKMCSEGLNAPEVYGVSPDGMAYIQEDLGDCQLFELLKGEIASGGKFSPEHMELLRKVMRALPAVQFKTAKGFDYDVCFPDKAFNLRMLNFDLNYFKYDFLKFTPVPFDEIKLQDDFDALIQEALSDVGDTFMYRDFQARNIMVRDGEPWFIDFQGGRRGPVQYDLASFVWNAGTRFLPEVKRELEKTYVEALKEFVPVDEEYFHERYRLITLVRLLQELGAYGFRGIFERKQIFLDCIAPAQECLKELLQEGYPKYPELEKVLRAVAFDWKPSL